MGSAWAPVRVCRRPAATGVWRQTSCIWTLFATPPVVRRWPGGVWREATILRTFPTTRLETAPSCRLCLGGRGNFDTSTKSATPNPAAATPPPARPDPSLDDAVENAAITRSRDVSTLTLRDSDGGGGDPGLPTYRRAIRSYRPSRCRSSTQRTVCGSASTSSRSRFTTTGSCPLRTTTHDSASSASALIS